MDNEFPGRLSNMPHTRSIEQITWEGICEMLDAREILTLAGERGSNQGSWLR